MIKLNRGACPNELTEELRVRLTDRFKGKGTDVWNDDCIKPYLKKALSSDMSHEKCSYCECRLNVESNDATIDHIIPKSINEDVVLVWDNLILSCLRCNRQKNVFEENIINPCVHDPKEHFYFVLSRYMIKGKSSSELGEVTVDVLDLNDIERLRKQRFRIGEKVRDELAELNTKINTRLTRGWNPTIKDINALIGIMEEALPKSDYSATVATVLLNDTNFKSIVASLKSIAKWNTALDSLQKEIEQVQLSIKDNYLNKKEKGECKMLRVNGLSS